MTRSEGRAGEGTRGPEGRGMRPARDGGSRGAEKAVVLLSGGMDSAAAAAVARVRGFEIYALTVDYGQRHRRELGCARRLARFFGAREHRVIRSGLGELGGSALTDRSIAVPEGKEWRPGARVPATYVPARNLVLLSLAAAYAETLGAGAIFIGANAVDYSGYPDCRPGFLRAFERALRLGTARGSSGLPIRILAPLMRVSKAGIVRLGVRLGVPFELTWSCYRGGRRPCGRCDACRLRAGGFRDAGLEDPLERATRARGTGHVGSPRERVQEGTGRRRAPGRRGCGN